MSLINKTLYFYRKLLIYAVNHKQFLMLTKLLKTVKLLNGGMFRKNPRSVSRKLNFPTHEVTQNG